MKYKTFRTIVILGGVGAVAGLGYLWCGGDPDPDRIPEAPSSSASAAAPGAAASEPVKAASSPSEPSVASKARGAVGLRELDRAVLALCDRALPGGKQKDALSSQAYKVNLYQDPGFKQVNRLKIDLDRDEKWDEKWTIEREGGLLKIKRQVAPADDEKYEEEWVRDEEYWVSPAMHAAVTGAEAAAVPGTPPGAAGSPSPASERGLALRPFDQALVDLSGRAVAGGKQKDALPGRPFKVNLYQDAGQATANRLKIDLDRDDKWDEKWTFEQENGRLTIKRQVAPADDEQYTQEYSLQDKRWIPR